MMAAHRVQAPASARQAHPNPTTLQALLENQRLYGLAQGERRGFRQGWRWGAVTGGVLMIMLLSLCALALHGLGWLAPVLRAVGAL